LINLLEFSLEELFKAVTNNRKQQKDTKTNQENNKRNKKKENIVKNLLLMKMNFQLCAENSKNFVIFFFTFI